MILWEKVLKKVRVEIIICIICNALGITTALCQIPNMSNYIICLEEIIAKPKKDRPNEEEKKKNTSVTK